MASFGMSVKRSTADHSPPRIRPIILSREESRYSDRRKELVMATRLSSLTDEQAQSALLKFYELLPAELWGDEKPSWVALEGLVQDLADEADDVVRHDIQAVRATTDSKRRGELARFLLERLEEVDAFRPIVESAVEFSLAPRMVPIPLVIGAVIVIAAALPKVTATDKTGRTTIEIDTTGNLVKLVDALRAFVKEVPKELVVGLAKGASGA